MNEKIKKFIKLIKNNDYTLKEAIEKSELSNANTYEFIKGLAYLYAGLIDV